MRYDLYVNGCFKAGDAVGARFQDGYFVAFNIHDGTPGPSFRSTVDRMSERIAALEADVAQKDSLISFLQARNVCLEEELINYKNPENRIRVLWTEPGHFFNGDDDGFTL